MVLVVRVSTLDVASWFERITSCASGRLYCIYRTKTIRLYHDERERSIIIMRYVASIKTMEGFRMPCMEGHEGKSVQ